MSEKPVAIVTGSSRGIGRAIAVTLARKGYRVTVNFVRGAEAADGVVSEILQFGGEAIAVGASVGVAEQRHRLLDETVTAFGRVDLLVNNAGITSQGRKDILEATEESWDVVFDTNLKGPFFLSQMVAKQMLAQRRNDASSDASNDASNDASDSGAIVNISSISAFTVSTNRADYCMSKAAMKMMTQLYATRLAQEGIRVFEVIPGIISTDMTSSVRQKYDRMIEQEGVTPIRRWGEPQDVANAVVALTRREFSFTTGESIHVDGGFHIRRL